MKTAIIIPARYASIRLPGKPLLADTGKPMIQHVYEQAQQAKHASAVIVATDDRRIYDCVKAFGGGVVMTSPDHDSGSSRAAEAARHVDADIIVNLQGDEPEVDPAHLDRLIEIKLEFPCFAATLACPFSITTGAGSPDDASAVKMIAGRALRADVVAAKYFTRSVCAYPRDKNGAVDHPQRYYLHVGVYAFHKTDLHRFAAMGAGALEYAERLEQLRILEAGESIVAGIMPGAASGVDTRADYEAFVRRERKGRMRG